MVRVRLPPGLPLGLLRDLVGEQHPHGAAVEVDDPRLTAGRLRRTERQAPVRPPARRARLVGHPTLDDLHELLTHHQPSALKVDVGPAQPTRLAAP
ncbi:MAG TPA: hypothetical protein VGH76_26800 [Actinomycetospora sp.]